MKHKAPMPRTIEAFEKLAARDLELIMEMKEEIGMLKAQVNKLQQKVNKHGIECK